MAADFADNEIHGGTSPIVRIDGSSRLNGTGYANAAKRAAPQGGFALGQASPETHVANAAPVGASASIDALLALQAAEDPLHAKRKLVRRGQALLDTLDAVKTDLLAGRVSEGRLNQLLSLIGQARERTQPGLDSLLDDIELRARVELAKFGRYAEA